MKTLFYFLILFSCLLSCKNNTSEPISNSEVQTIDFYKNYSDKLEFSSFIDTIQFIPLETTADNLIGEINRVIFSNGKYYIHATNSMQNGKLLIFDDDGKFLGKFDKRGAGPNEYLELKDFAITNEDNIVISTYRKLLLYDNLGNFIYSIPLDDLSPKEILSTQNNEILSYNFGSVYFDNKLLSLINKHGIDHMFFCRSNSEARKSDLLVNWRSLVEHDSSFYLNYPYCDTIFSITPSEIITAKYAIDYGNMKLRNFIIDKDESLNNWEDRLRKSGDYLSVASYGISDHYVYIGSIDNNNVGYLTLYSFKSQQAISAHKLIDDIFLKGNIIPLTAKQIPHNMVGNEIIWELEPDILISGFNRYWSKLSDSDKESFKFQYPDLYHICTLLKDDDNPILLKMRIKNF